MFVSSVKKDLNRLHHFSVRKCLQMQIHVYASPDNIARKWLTVVAVQYRK